MKCCTIFSAFLASFFTWSSGGWFITGTWKKMGASIKRSIKCFHIYLRSLTSDEGLVKCFWRCSVRGFHFQISPKTHPAGLAERPRNEAPKKLPNGEWGSMRGWRTRVGKLGWSTTSFFVYFLSINLAIWWSRTRGFSVLCLNSSLGLGWFSWSLCWMILGCWIRSRIKKNG